MSLIHKFNTCREKEKKPHQSGPLNSNGAYGVRRNNPIPQNVTQSVCMLRVHDQRNGCMPFLETCRDLLSGKFALSV